MKSTINGEIYDLVAIGALDESVTVRRKTQYRLFEQAF